MVCHVAGMQDKRSSCRVLVVMPEDKQLHGTPKLRWERGCKNVGAILPKQLNFLQ